MVPYGSDTNAGTPAAASGFESSNGSDQRLSITWASAGWLRESSITNKMDIVRIILIEAGLCKEVIGLCEKLPEMMKDGDIKSVTVDLV